MHKSLKDGLFLFTIGNIRYAIELFAVGEVFAPTAIFPAPFSPPPILGLINFHGNIVAAVDIEQVMERPGLRRRIDNMLVLDRQFGDLALAVDSVEGILLENEVLEEIESQDRLVEKVLLLPDGEAMKLALPALVDRLSSAMRR